MTKFWQAAALGALMLAGCSDDPTAPDVDQLQVTDLVVGTGATAALGNTITAHYTGWLYDDDAADHKGAKFDSSYDRNQPITPTLGGNLIDGWNQGLPGMKVGGKRLLIIPSRLAYGPYGYGAIPPGAALVFEVELLDIQ